MNDGEMPKAKEPPALVACLPTAWGPAGVPGATVDTCTDCGQPVWLSPATEAVRGILSPPPPLVCITCTESRLAGSEDGPRVRPVILEEQIRELERVTGVDGKEILARLQQKMPGLKRRED